MLMFRSLGKLIVLKGSRDHVLVSGAHVVNVKSLTSIVSVVGLSAAAAPPTACPGACAAAAHVVIVGVGIGGGGGSGGGPPQRRP
jgi:hypothetical protein